MVNTSLGDIGAGAKKLNGKALLTPTVKITLSVTPDIGLLLTALIMHVD